MPGELKTKAIAQAAALKKEVTQRTVGYITAGLGLVAGLAWNDAIKSLIELLFPAETSTIILKFAYALIFTVVLVVITIQLNHLFTKDK